MSPPDFTLIEKLRKENIDQFFTLVRMHLSFVVDINTDDVDCSTDKPKQQFRWNFKKSKSCTANSSQTNTNTKNNTEINSITEDGIARVYELIDFLSKEDNVKQEGIFRRTGSLSRQQELRQLLLTGSGLALDEGRFTVHDCASVLKGFIAELPQPLLMDQYYQTYCTLAAQYPATAEASESKLLLALQLLLLLLTPVHRSFLERLLKLLRVAADNEASNRMSPDTLATMFTPHLLCPRKLSPETFHSDSLALAPLVSFMIRHALALFAPPARLVTDIAAYFTVRERKRLVSPQLLDESISDRTAANTIYTFVDRTRTRVENATNPTDTALAQLYAHIQALPESQHKRRLVKQFNRQNGYGTPIQVQRTGKAAGSRSFGDSIKRHIFNKGLLNKTPKKGSGSAINTVEEKHSSKRLASDDTKTDVTHKNVVLKNLANKMASTESLDNEDFDSDASNESTLSEGAISNRSKKLSPKFISEPNLSILDGRMDEETPKNPKKHGSRLFRSKILSASQNINKRYQKRAAVRGTPTSCVSCFDEHDTTSENEISCPETQNSPIDVTPKKTKKFMKKEVEDSEEEIEVPMRMHYLTSTPGMAEAAIFDDDVATPYTMNFRRASMSPITKSTQKLSKAMQESIMTPRSRKPLIITSEQRDCLPPAPDPLADPGIDPRNPAPDPRDPGPDIYHSLSPKNDSDFVSSDDDMASRSSQFSLDKDMNVSSTSAVRSENTHFVISHERPVLIPQDDLNTTLCGDDVLVPKFKIAHEMSEQKGALSDPFREYLLSRSVLTATPVDLSIINKSSDDTDDKITDSLLFCLDGNVPSDLTSSISNLAVEGVSTRSPFKSIDSFVNIDAQKSPNRKRTAAKTDEVASGSKKPMVEKENLQCCETEL
ncbi:hypothetical protein JYU34_017673 [Plutella xylostella]|uniref:Rho-GAP domain-containing protein n=1 Tax=Plutella xylostella TaxID=51655 RepID=A0ABQ7Q1P5_PLUXY|nr:hypothetical protein JYU34_017673 [Plutella xylostella]